MKLFQYAVILNPKNHKGEKTSEKSKIIVEPTYVLANDPGAATLLAARSIPEDFVSRLDEVEVAVRPF